MLVAFSAAKIYKNYILCNNTDKITYIFRQDYILQDRI